MHYLYRIVNSKLFFFAALLMSLIYLGYHAYAYAWIDTSLLLSRIVFVFVVLSSLKRFPLIWVLPASVAIGPLFDRLLDYLESPLMDIVRLVLGDVVNPQFILIGLVVILLIYTVLLLLFKKSLRLLFIFVFLVANIGASSLFHYTQVDQFIKLENQRMMKQANLLYANLKSSGFENIGDICALHGLTCVYGTSKKPIGGIDEDFYPMFNQAVNSLEPAYRTMRKFSANEDDPTKANMYQIFMFSYYDKWFYFSDQDIISPYYFNARRNFSILYSTFSVVWMFILSYILYRHSAFIDKRVTLFRKKN